MKDHFQIAAPALVLALFVSAIFALPIEFDAGGRELPKFEKAVEARAREFIERLNLSAEEMDTIHIVVAYSREEFHRKSRGGIPDWGVGAAIPAKGEIILLLREGSESPRSLNLVAHEMGHVFLHRKTGGIYIPRWFDEGFCQWVEGPMEFSKSSRLARAVLFGNTIPLADLDRVNSWNADQAQLAYAESRAAFDYVLELTGGRVDYLIRSIAEHRDFQSGFEAALGMSLSRFYAEWSIERGRRFNWSLLFADWRVIFALITLLFLVLGSIKLIKIRRRKLAEEDEETQAHS